MMGFDIGVWESVVDYVARELGIEGGKGKKAT